MDSGVGKKLGFILITILIVLSVAGIYVLYKNEGKLYNIGSNSTATHSATNTAANTAANTPSSGATHSDGSAHTPTPLQTPSPTTGQTPIADATHTPTHTPAPTPTPGTIPEGFVYVDDVIDSVILDIRYFTSNNFTGAPIDGYDAPKAILTREASEALLLAANALRRYGYGIIIYDAYRPQKAVDCFLRWLNDPNDPGRKLQYPNITKQELLSKGYIAAQSTHSAGSTVDLGLYFLATNQPVDMGSDFDIFDEISHHGAAGLTSAQSQARQILRDVMRNAGFNSSDGEWWHYTLANNPYSGQYFDFNVR